MAREQKTGKSKIIVKDGVLSPMDFYEREQKQGNARVIPQVEDEEPGNDRNGRRGAGSRSAGREKLYGTSGRYGSAFLDDEEEEDSPRRTPAPSGKRRKLSATTQHFILLFLTLLAITTVAAAAAIFAGGQQNGENTGGSGALSFKEFLASGQEGADGYGDGNAPAYIPDAFDSADTAVLVGRDDAGNTMSFLNLDSGRFYTLSVDGTTKFYDKYGTILSATQVSVGDVTDIKFLKEQKHLASLQLSPSAWNYEAVDEYEIYPEKNKVSIGADEYKLTSDTQLFSEDDMIELMDLNPTDVLNFQGIGKQVLSITVEKGHGYLRLKNDENFIGGWIEVGQSMICKITEDMLLAVPEGNFEITISHRGGGGKKTATIYRDEETTLDIGDLEVPAPKSGQVLFSVNPADAEVYIDGTLVNTAAPVNLLYGLHQLIARAEGYQSITQYIRVAQPSAGINVTLDPAGSGEESASSAGEANTTTDYYKVYVDAPVGAEVYVDGNYIGIAPCSFRKKEGSYVIILRKSGYETRSYTVNIDDSEKDLSYSFADLVENP